MIVVDRRLTVVAAGCRWLATLADLTRRSRIERMGSALSACIVQAGSGFLHALECR